MSLINDIKLYLGGQTPALPMDQEPLQSPSNPTVFSEQQKNALMTQMYNEYFGQGEQNYISGVEDWMRSSGADPELEKQRNSGLDPNLELDLDNPSVWSMRYMRRQSSI